MTEYNPNHSPPEIPPLSLPNYIWSAMCSTINPQDVPATKRLRDTLIILTLAFSFLSAYISFQQISAILYAIVDLMFLYLFVYTILSLSKLKPRIAQTFNTLLAVHIGFILLSLPVHYYVQKSGMLALQTTSETNPFSVVIAFLSIGVFIWSLRAIGHIYAQALEIRMRFGIAIALLYMLMNLFVSSFVGASIAMNAAT